MSEIVYVNGEFLPAAEAKISVFDHGLLYGDGIFEGIRFYERNIFRLKEHIERLYDSAKYIMLNCRRSQQEMMDLVIECCRRNDLNDGYIRLVITRGAGTLGLNPYLCEFASTIVIVSKIQMYPREFYENGLPIVTVATRRVASDALSPRVKSLNYLNNILAKMEAVHSGVLEALMLDASGFVAECSADNFFIVKKGVVYTPPSYVGALRGVTRDVVMEIAHAEQLEVREERFTLYEVYTADECFLTGTAAEVVPVTSVDKRTIGDGKVGDVTKRLLAGFQKITATDGVRF